MHAFYIQKTDLGTRTSVPAQISSYDNKYATNGGISKK